MRRVTREGVVREHVHGEHDGERLGGARSDGVRHGIAAGRRPPGGKRSFDAPRQLSSTRSRTTVDRPASSRKSSFENAIAVAAALGGSTNACLHLPALAGEAGIEFGLADIDRISRRTPQIAEMRPAGRFMMQDLHVEGGVPVVMRELLDADLLDGAAMTVTGRTLAEELANVTRSREPRTPVLHTVADPVKTTGGYAVLWGNLAPDGAVIKVANQTSNRHRGPAKVYDGEQDAFRAVADGRIQPGDVVVLRYEGPKGGPGMPEMTHLTSAIVGAGLVENTALLTDGRFGGGTQGISVGHISPEAAAGGPLSILRDGDIVEIDAEANRPTSSCPTTRSPTGSPSSSIHRLAIPRVSWRNTPVSSARPRRARASGLDPRSAGAQVCSSAMGMSKGLVPSRSRFARCGRAAEREIRGRLNNLV